MYSCIYKLVTLFIISIIYIFLLMFVLSYIILSFVSLCHYLYMYNLQELYSQVCYFFLYLYSMFVCTLIPREGVERVNQILQISIYRVAQKERNSMALGSGGAGGAAAPRKPPVNFHVPQKA